MPKIALSVDREAIRAKYLAGTTATELSKEYGVKLETIRTWVNRYRWSRPGSEVNIRREFRKANITGSIQDSSERVRHGLSEEIERQIGVLRSLQVKRRIPDLAERTAAVASIAKTASTVFGWSQESQSSVIDIRSLSQDEPIPSPQSLEQPPEQAVLPISPVPPIMPV